ncbi:hypothetical protein B566_EDAN012581 [Ephemera danica]|nr:hypothetical protein B566_EDAN012581 [Ephemera danica]
MTCLEKQEVLGEHNKFRRQLAISMVPVQPNAANLAEMVWDEELADIAQRWADQCIFASDENRQVDRFLVGQNVYQSSQSPGNDDVTSNFSEATKSWFNEYFYFSSTKIDPFVFVPAAAHYTQLEWAKSWALGCRFTVYDEGTTTKKLYICNYGPTGNVAGESMYKMGPPNCPYYGMEPSLNYTGLCVVTDTNPPGIEC